MTFRASTKASYDQVLSRAAGLKSYLSDAINQLQSTSSANLVKEVLLTLIQAKAEFEIATNVPGIVAYAKAQEGDLTYDVVAEFTNLVLLIDDAIAWIVTNMPTSVGGYVELETWSTSGVTVRTFAPGATSGLRSELQTVVDAID